MSSMSLTMTVGPSATRTSDLFLSSLAPIVHLIGLCTFSSPPFHYLALPSFSIPPFDSLALPSFSSLPFHYLAFLFYPSLRFSCLPCLALSCILLNDFLKLSISYQFIPFPFITLHFFAYLSPTIPTLLLTFMFFPID